MLLMLECSMLTCCSTHGHSKVIISELLLELNYHTNMVLFYCLCVKCNYSMATACKMLWVRSWPASGNQIIVKCYFTASFHIIDPSIWSFCPYLVGLDLLLIVLSYIVGIDLTIDNCWLFNLRRWSSWSSWSQRWYIDGRVWSKWCRWSCSGYCWTTQWHSCGKNWQIGCIHRMLTVWLVNVVIKGIM